MARSGSSGQTADCGFEGTKNYVPIMTPGFLYESSSSAVNQLDKLADDGIDYQEAF